MQGPWLRIAESKRTIDAGTVQPAESRDFRFEVENIGDRTLEFALTRQSCGCLEVKSLPKVPPHGRDSIVLSWTPPVHPVDDIKRVELETNDPNARTLSLTIHGKVEPVFGVVPLSASGWVDFMDVKLGEVKEYALSVYSTVWPSFDLKAEVKGVAGDGKAFEVTMTRLSPGDQVRKDGAEVAIRSGYLVVVKTVPDLPRGLVKRQLVLTIAPPGDQPREVVIPVAADTANNLFSIAPAQKCIIDGSTNILEGAEASFVLQFKTPQEDGAVKVVGTDPKFLRADVTPVGDRTRWKLTLRIPKGDPEVRKYHALKYLSGRVLLKVAGSDREASVEVEWDGASGQEKK
jgi:hypothetical protein